ncbi:Hypothetical predicted protein [Drosophila guanche]|uniref:Uncharacterized protein n=1 Tax=Drosophila guanche TaxID=7266 RepID=A0A3B0JD18_DROGU|nr:Hypothetical predicted protein [Drosophila guanche]
MQLPSGKSASGTASTDEHASRATPRGKAKATAKPLGLQQPSKAIYMCVCGMCFWPGLHYSNKQQQHVLKICILSSSGGACFCNYSKISSLHSLLQQKKVKQQQQQKKRKQYILNLVAIKLLTATKKQQLIRETNIDFSIINIINKTKEKHNKTKQNKKKS